MALLVFRERFSTVSSGIFARLLLKFFRDFFQWIFRVYLGVSPRNFLVEYLRSASWVFLSTVSPGVSRLYICTQNCSLMLFFPEIPLVITPIVFLGVLPEIRLEFLLIFLREFLTRNFLQEILRRNSDKSPEKSGQELPEKKSSRKNPWRNFWRNPCGEICGNPEYWSF